MSLSRLVKSSKLMFNFTVNQLNKEDDISVLSMFEDKLLIGTKLNFHLFVYNQEGHQISSFTVNDSDGLWDAKRTNQGKIIFTTFANKKLYYKYLVTSETSNISTASFIQPTTMYLRVSDVIFNMAYWQTDEYQPADDSVSCALIFHFTKNGPFCWQVMKVTIANSDDFWTVERNTYFDFRLRVYSVDTRRLVNNVSWKNISTTMVDKTKIDLTASSLSYDGSMNIFLSDYNNKVIHVFLVNGQYHGQLLASSHIKNKPLRLLVDKTRQLLYVGESNNIIEIFSLIYHS